jgi:ribosomal protein S6--L-glutamate ligase
MKVGILSRGPKLYSTQRLVDAARRRGHDVHVLDTLAFSIVVEEDAPGLLYQGAPVVAWDAVIPRIGASLTLFGTAVVRQFEQMGVFTLASSHAISVARDKLRSIQVLSRHTVGFPPTVFLHDPSRVEQAIEEIGGPPAVIKVLEGTQGVGVILCESVKNAQQVLETLQLARQHVLIQKFVAESRGRDLRAFVVGDRVVAAMRRVAQGDEFRANVHRGGRVEKVELTAEYAAVAIRAAQIMGLRVAGVDMLESEDGPKVIEVNSSPGLEGIEEATGVDVADAVIVHLEEQVLFPDVDLRQRLTLKSGYGVAEIAVDRESTLAHARVGWSGLRERDVAVLSIQRGSVTIPNPGDDREILPGDTLLCFGKLLTMRAMIPTQRASPVPVRRARTVDGEDAAVAKRGERRGG